MIVTLNEADEYNLARNRADWKTKPTEARRALLLVAEDDILLHPKLRISENDHQSGKLKRAVFELAYFRINAQTERDPSLAGVKSNDYEESYFSPNVLKMANADGYRDSNFPGWPDRVINLLKPWHVITSLRRPLRVR
ncbi:hypothetical protein [Leptospira stimsonii]|uniref:Uncharacterized protein n=1 Tax=Leptospira stimsonii TaxID=2202203 RepID=A0ABY2N5F4_9LEPT|nr:hypothetical protein [Leptospira stimsonii]TGK10356.1 hypothetical protein EHO98_22860 [Leptospira stimsonii]TGM17241.1 hypothetical protein EHQ90_07605 [Leptospira stimsonii]